ncbi:site-specific integrase [Parvicella tangerina]|uniref:Tyrosine recombinase XerC n=1 Tax=Parvicella tangerina TaxID=2829795 RepID=A0A916NTK3_9FLAO|nr:site-specific integrase [Parvicella tangerina]CAG5085984.1 Tyrosine recombinase XerC [Parvicella tangerina]
MNTSQKFYTLFHINKQRVKDGKAPLYMRVYVNGTRTEISTPFKVNVKDWHPKLQRIKSGRKDAMLINAFLDESQSKLNKLFIVSVASGEVINAKELRDRFQGKKETEPEHKTIIDAFEYHNKKMEEKVNIGKITRKTSLRYQSTQNKVVTFIKRQYKVEDMALKDIRLAFITEFDHYLLTVEKLQSNTAHKIIKIVKKIMNQAVALDWINSNPFNQFKCTYKNPERIVLTQMELDALMNKEFDTPRLEEVRDVFIFQCYTGFAYTDMYNFTKNDISIGMDGEYWLSTYRQKTGTKENVPLLPVALQLIEKYQDHPYCVTHDKLLPVNSNQRYNAYLKEIADLCGIKKRITTHIARHTFATTVTLSNGVPIETVSRILGHTRLATTQIYAKVLEKKVSEDMQLLKEKMNQKTIVEKENTKRKTIT